MNNDFDDILRKKWEEKNFPMDDQHRKDMLMLLETNSKRRIGFFWWFGGLLMVVAIIGALFYFNSNHPLNVNADQVNNLPDAEHSTHQINSIDDISNEKSTIAEKESFSKSKEVRNEATNQTVEKSSLSTPVSKFNLKSEKKATPGKTASLKTKSAKIAYHKDRKNEVLPAKVNSIPSTNKIFATAPLANESNDIIIPNHSPSVISNAVSVVILPDDAVIDQATMQPVVQKVRLPAQLESIFFSEIINENGQNENIVTHVSSHFHGLNFFVETGASFIPGLVNEYEQGWNFNAGGGIGYKLGTKTSLIVSGGYLLQNKGFEFERTSAVIQKDFGIRSNFNSLHPDKLHFIYSQIGIQYQLKRNLFSLFGGMQWLYGAQGNIFIRSTDQFGNNVETNDYTWLSTNGMRHLLWNGEVSYGYRITPRISINGGIKYYFSSIDKEDVTLSQEGYYWKGRYSSFTPSINLNYHLYGKR